MVKGFFSKELGYTCIIMGGSMTFGFTMAFWSPAAHSMSADLHLSPTWGNVFNTISVFFAILGGPLSNIFVSYFGRKYPLFGTGLLTCICYFSLSFTRVSFKWLAFVLRAIIGLCLGSFSGICPMYITELAPPHLRGAYGTLNQLGICCGASVCYLLGVWLRWDLISLIGGIPSALMCLLLWIVPESPVSTRERVNETLFQKKFVRPLVLAGFLMFFQQMTGLTLMLTQLQRVFEDCGSSLDPAISSFLVGIAGAFACLLCSPMVEKFGRKPMWHLSGIGQFISIFLMGLEAKFHFSRVIPIICLFAMNFLFSIGYGPVPWFFVPELFPDSVRSLANSSATATNWLFATIGTFLYPVIRDSIGLSWGFFVFSIVCFLAILFGFFFLPESRGVEMGQVCGSDASPNLGNDTPLLADTET